jgi:hypothetical protein
VKAQKRANGPQGFICAVIFGKKRVIIKLRTFWYVKAMVTIVPRVRVGQISDVVREKTGVWLVDAYKTHIVSKPTRRPAKTITDSEDTD